MRRVLGDKHPDTLVSMRNLVGLRVADGRAAECADLARAMYAATLEQNGPDHPETLWTMDMVAITTDALGDFDEAQRVMRDLVERSERLLGEDDPVTANRVGNLGILLLSNERYDQAEPVLRRALALNDRLHGERDAFSLQLLAYLARVQRSRSEDYAAEVLLAEALDRGRDRPPADEQIVDLRWQLCLVLRDDERYDEVLELLEASRDELREVHGPDDRMTQACEAVIMDTLVRAERLDEARALEARLLPYLERLEPVAGEDELRRPPSAE
jgi:tetratricopeptide (TPR) repeat protein